MDVNNVSYVKSSHSIYVYMYAGKVIVATLESSLVPTVRHVNCHMLVRRPSGSCSVCKRYRQTLYALQYKKDTQPPSAHPEMPTSHVNF